MKKVGLVGGISWVSTMEYYKQINEGVNLKLGGLQFAECVIYSLNFADIQRVSWENSYPLILQACQSLRKSGVDAIALCANTAHLFTEKLEKDIGLPLIDIVSETAFEIQKLEIKKVALMGTKYTMEMDFYKNKIKEYGIEVIVPEDQETRNYIQQTLKEELGRGVFKQETQNAYIHIANDLIAMGAKGVVLGCTEIPLLLNQSHFSIPIFDTTKIHIDAIVSFLIS